MHPAAGRRAAGWLVSELVGSLALLAGPVAAEGQSPGPTYRIGYLTSAAHLPGGFDILFREFGLRELGYIEGRNVVFERRPAGERADVLRAFAAELVQGRPDVIIAEGTAAARAARDAAATIPIVMAVSGDPVATGLVQSLARPGGNVTGFTTLSSALAGKRLQLLTEVLGPGARVGVLWHEANVDMRAEWKETEAAARQLRLTVISVGVSGDARIEESIAAAVAGGAKGFVVLADSRTTASAPTIARAIARHRVAVVYGAGWSSSGQLDRDVPGALMTFGPISTDLARIGAGYVDRILKGARPSDLPVEQPTRFELTVNLKAARALGIRIPPALRLRADHLIE